MSIVRDNRPMRDVTVRLNIPGLGRLRRGGGDARCSRQRVHSLLALPHFPTPGEGGTSTLRSNTGPVVTRRPTAGMPTLSSSTFRCRRRLGRSRRTPIAEDPLVGVMRRARPGARNSSADPQSLRCRAGRGHARINESAACTVPGWVTTRGQPARAGSPPILPSARPSGRTTECPPRCDGEPPSAETTRWRCPASGARSHVEDELHRGGRA